MSVSRIAPENEFRIKHLLNAFQMERQAQISSAAFASKADSDGFHGIASLFRAVSRAKQILAENHAHVICQLGGESEPLASTPEVKSTLENVRASLARETYVSEVMYPAFLAGSEAQGDSTAQTLNWASRAATSHMQLFNKANASLESGESTSWTATPRYFYVRRVCGNTSDSTQSDRCWMCDHMCGIFEVVG